MSGNNRADPNYLLRFLSDQQKRDFEQLADEDGVSLNKWFLGLGELALARRRKRNAEALDLKDLEQQSRAKWQEVIDHWEQCGVITARAHRNKWVIVGEAMWGRHLPRGFKYCVVAADDPAPTSCTRKGRTQLEREARELLTHYAFNHASSSTRIRRYPMAMMDKLFEEYLAIEDELADRRGDGGGGAFATALAATSWAAHRPDRARDDDFNYDDLGYDDDESGSGYYEEGESNDDDLGDNLDDKDSDVALDEGDENEKGDDDEMTAPGDD
jgi:hypothetical protein